MINPTSQCIPSDLATCCEDARASAGVRGLREHFVDNPAGMLWCGDIGVVQGFSRVWDTGDFTPGHSQRESAVLAEELVTVGSDLQGGQCRQHRGIARGVKRTDGLPQAQTGQFIRIGRLVPQHQLRCPRLPRSNETRTGRGELGVVAEDALADTVLCEDIESRSLKRGRDGGSQQCSPVSRSGFAGKPDNNSNTHGRLWHCGATGYIESRASARRTRLPTIVRCGRGWLALASYVAKHSRDAGRCCHNQHQCVDRGREVTGGNR